VCAYVRVPVCVRARARGHCSMAREMHAIRCGEDFVFLWVLVLKCMPSPLSCSVVSEDACRWCERSGQRRYIFRVRRASV
jgi:hypothetical protein